MSGGRVQSLRRAVRRHYHTVYGAICLAAAVVVLALGVLQGLPIFSTAELKAYDFQLAHRGNLPTPQDMVFVGVDQTSINFLANGTYPLPRRTMADAINFLHRAGARTIVLDFIYARQTRDDSALASAIRRAGNVVVADELAYSDASNYLAAETQLLEPVESVRRAAAGVGLANFPKDSDGVIRQADVEQPGPGGTSIGSRLYPSLALRAAAVTQHRSVAQVLRGLPNPLNINYVGAQNPGDASQQTFLTHQFASVALGEEAPKLYRGKIVIVGCAAATCVDTQNTPYGDMYGALVEANALRTILHRDPIMPAGDVTNFLILAGLTLLVALACLRFGFWISTGTAVGLAVLYAIFTFVLFDSARVWINLVMPETALVLVFGAVMALRFATEERRRRRTHQKFGLYVKPEIVEILVSSPDEETALAGARRPLSVLFVDVRGFTTLSEMLEPEQVLAALDIYLEELTASVHAYEGTLNKYVGDELMAIWNAPRIQQDHAVRAVKAAIDMVRRMDVINAKLAELDLPAIGFGVGVNSGDAVVGEMGSSFRKQYDVIGDAINTGARLCSAAGIGEIIIGEGTRELIGDLFELEELEGLPLKGKQQRVRTYSVRIKKAEGTGGSIDVGQTGVSLSR